MADTACVRRLLLASRGIPELDRRLGARGTRAVLIPTAANPLGEPAIADEAIQHGARIAVLRR